jgi:ribosome maturation factor RimP
LDVSGPGVNVKMTNFGDFANFRRKKDNVMTLFHTLVHTQL